MTRARTEPLYRRVARMPCRTRRLLAHTRAHVQCLRLRLSLCQRFSLPPVFLPVPLPWPCRRMKRRAYWRQITLIEYYVPRRAPTSSAPSNLVCVCALADNTASMPPSKASAPACNATVSRQQCCRNSRRDSQVCSQSCIGTFFARAALLQSLHTNADHCHFASQTALNRGG